jgi:hypothetical protein
MMRRQSGSDGASGIAGCWLNPQAIHDSALQKFSVGDTVESDPTG